MKMAILTSKNNCQLIALCLLMLTVNNVAASKQIKKKDSAIASEEIKVPQESQVQSVDNATNAKHPEHVQELNDAAKNANLPSAAAKVTPTNVEQKQHGKKKPSELTVDSTIEPKERWNHIAEESQFNLKETNYDYDDDELPQSFVTSFYIFLGLSIGAMLFILVKVYRLRLTRAERKYGVQGDRSTQELVPLPVSVEDGISEDEDHTLFEVNRQQIRIL